MIFSKSNYVWNRTLMLFSFKISGMKTAKNEQEERKRNLEEIAINDPTSIRKDTVKLNKSMKIARSWGFAQRQIMASVNIAKLWICVKITTQVSLLKKWIFFAGLPTCLPTTLVGRVFANGPGDLGSIAGRVIPKILKMVLDTSWRKTRQYKVRIKGKVEQFREWSSALTYTSV